ncbi:peptide deformylase [bacterium]|nr:peptide deformylase [bacterium]
MKHVITYPDPVLRQQAEPVDEIDDEIRRLADEMSDVMYNDDGVGLAANQVGETKRIIVFDAGEGFHCLINPEITPVEDETEVREEGCLSLPGVQVNVERYKRIKVEALDLAGAPFSDTLEGLAARAVQHEVDHLNGIMIIDHASSLQRRMMRSKLRKLEKEA